MKLFLVEFDRSEQRLVGALKAFPPSRRTAALAARFDAQRRVLREDLNHDVVLLEAESEAALRRTHASFFMTPAELTKRMEAVR